MVNENIKTIIENKKPFETVQELKDEYKILSFEEFNKAYEPSEEVEILTEAEWKDRVLHGPQFGPGNEQSKTAAKVVGGAALTALTVVCPPAGIAVGSGIAAGGTAMTITGLARDDEEMTVAGLETIGVGAGAVIKGSSNANSGKK